MLLAGVFVLVFASWLFGIKGNERVLLEYKDYATQASIYSDMGRYVGVLNEDLSADQVVEFQHESYDIAFDIHFNELWGGKEFMLKPYETYKGYDAGEVGVVFGPVRVVGSHAVLSRDFMLKNKEVLRTDEFIKKLKEDNKWDPEADYNELYDLPEVEQVNDVTIASYTTGGSCEINHVEIFGGSVNYELSHTCESFRSMNDLLEIARSVRLK